MNQELIEEIVRKVVERIKDNQILEESSETAYDKTDLLDLVDITSKESKGQVLLKDPQNMEALEQMKTKTAARIGVGRSGTRLNTRTLITLRADHAIAHDAVMVDVNEDLLHKNNLKIIQSLCQDRNEHLTRPDLGARFSIESLNELKKECKLNPQVQIYVSDGLSSKAVESNIENVLPSLIDGLERYGINVGTTFFVKYGRVPSMDIISETLASEVTCLLIGERPGLATAKSMSAYIAYKASVGMTESRRTVISNIHDGGINAVEAGAYIADVIKKMLELKVSGVGLKL